MQNVLSVWTRKGRNVADLVLSCREADKDKPSLCYLPLDTRKVILSFCTRSDWVKSHHSDFRDEDDIGEDEVDFAGQGENQSDEEDKSAPFNTKRSLAHSTFIM
jgi:hypothetical protein